MGKKDTISYSPFPIPHSAFRAPYSPLLAHEISLIHKISWWEKMENTPRHGVCYAAKSYKSNHCHICKKGVERLERGITIACIYHLCWQLIAPLPYFTSCGIERF